jgi:hypothetical protein
MQHNKAGCRAVGLADYHLPARRNGHAEYLMPRLLRSREALKYDVTIL